MLDAGSRSVHCRPTETLLPLEGSGVSLVRVLCRWAVCTLGTLALGPLVGCAGHRPPPSQAPVVRKIVFEGNGGGLKGTGDYSLRSAMEQGKSPALSFLAPRRRHVPVDLDTLALDGWRIENWYAHHGYFDAAFLGWDVVQVKPARRRKPAVVRLVGRVDEGPPSVVREIEWAGVESDPGPLTRLLERSTSPGEGERFDMDAVDETSEAARGRLQDSSFARAVVEPRVDSYPDEEVVDLSFLVDPGPACRIGDIAIFGDLSIPERLLLPELSFEEGDAFKASDLAATQRRLYGLGVFSVVKVEPVLTPIEGVPEDVVPVRIELAQSRAQQIRLGGGFSFESGKQEAHVIADYRHVNLGDRLVRLGLENEVGYTALATLGELTSEGESELIIDAAPTMETELNLRIPRFPGRAFALETQVGFELELEQAYRYASPSFGPALHWRASRTVTTVLGYELNYVDYLPGDVVLDASVSRGLDGRDPYFLSMLSQQVIVDRRDDVLQPRRGSYGTFGVDEAGGPFGGGYSFVRVQTDQRVYLPVVQIGGIVPRATVALRVAAGAIFPYGDEDTRGAPPPERLYLGGSTSVRGWGRYQLGPYSYACEDEEGGQAVCFGALGEVPDVDSSWFEDDRPDTAIDPDFTPIGGLASLLGGAELRAYPWGEYGFAVFSDAGMAWGSLQEVRDFRVLPVVGVGGRYRSPIGPLRLDVAVRLDREEMFLYEPRVNVHFSLSEAY